MSRSNLPTRTLRSRPDLDQLKRQAKELLTAFRAGAPESVSEVRQHYDGAEPSTFALHDAQLVLARAYGFASWTKLKAFVDGTTVGRLIEAVQSGDLTRVTSMLKARPELVNLDASGHDEHRALHHAVLRRSAPMVRLLLSHGADPRIGIYPYRDATSALTIARERHYDEIVALFEAVDAERGRSPVRNARPAVLAPPPELKDALDRGDSRAAIVWLESSPLLRANPALISSPGPDGIGLLHLSCARLMTDLVGWLLEHGADVHARSDLGFTPIDMLGRWPSAPLHEGVTAIAALLLAHGAERTAFSAVATNDAAWLRERHHAGALANDVSDVGGLVTFAVRMNRPEMLDLLLDFGFDPNERPGGSQEDPRPLQFCARLRHGTLADRLIARGATLTARLAVALGRADWLRARHLDRTLAQPTEGDGLLTTAIEFDREDMVRLLLELGVDANDTRRVGDGERSHVSRGDALERAISMRRLPLAAILLAHRADPQPAMWMAYRNRDQEVLDLLLSHGGVVTAATAGYHRDVALARQRVREEDEGRLPAGAVRPGHSVAEDLLDGDCGEPEIVRLALERLDWPRDDPRWYAVLKGPLAFWSHIPWIVSPAWPFDRTTYLACFRQVLARTHANQRGSFGRSILHDVMAMGKREGFPDWVTDEEVREFAVTLLDAGARLDVRDDLLQSTPLGWACRWGRVAVVRELLARGADRVESDTPEWATPRAWAGKMGHVHILAQLDEQ